MPDPAENKNTNKSKSRTGEGHISPRVLKIILAHLVLFTISLLLSFLVRYELSFDANWFPQVFLSWLGVMLIIKFIVFGLLHQYQSWWRYFSVSDMFAIFAGAFLSTLIAVLGFYTAYMIEPLRERMGPLLYLSQSVMLVDWAATILLIGGARLMIRLYYEETKTESGGQMSRILIVGAGNTGEVLLREIRRMPTSQYKVVGFIDDNPKKQGARIHGVPVLGTTKHIKEVSQKRKVEEIIIAMPSAPEEKLERLIKQCEGINLKFSRLGKFPDLVEIT